MDHAEMTRLVRFIGEMRAAKSSDPLSARVIEESPRLSAPLQYEVRARTPEGRFEFKSDALEMSYVPSTGLLVSRENGGRSDRSTHLHFPWQPPVLAMFSPLDLPLWGGNNDSHIITGIRERDGRTIRLDFGHKEDPENVDSSGFVVVDLAWGVAVELQYHDSIYSASSITETPLALAF